MLKILKGVNMQLSLFDEKIEEDKLIAYCGYCTNGIFTNAPVDKPTQIKNKKYYHYVCFLWATGKMGEHIESEED